MATTVDWLLEGPPFVQMAARERLLGERRSSPAVNRARLALLDDPRVRSLMRELRAWPVSPLNSHKSAGHAIHKLTFLADLGLQRDDPGVEAIARKVMAHVASEGPFQVLGVIGPQYGGTGKETWAWALCDAPLLVYALERLGYAEEPAVRPSKSPSGNNLHFGTGCVTVVNRSWPGPRCPDRGPCESRRVLRGPER